MAAFAAGSTHRDASRSGRAACLSAGRCSGARRGRAGGVERALAIPRGEFEIALTLLNPDPRGHPGGAPEPSRR
jgi:hypothetical protein